MFTLNNDEVRLLQILLKTHSDSYKDDAVYSNLVLRTDERIRRINHKENLLKSPTLFKVRYIADSGWHDATTYGEEYRVIGLVGSQYVIINDYNDTSHLQMNKFERVENPCQQ